MIKGNPTLSEKMRLGVVWLSIGEAAGRLFTVLAGIVLARILFLKTMG